MKGLKYQTMKYQTMNIERELERDACAAGPTHERRRDTRELALIDAGRSLVVEISLIASYRQFQSLRRPWLVGTSATAP